MVVVFSAMLFLLQYCDSTSILDAISLNSCIVHLRSISNVAKTLLVLYAPTHACREVKSTSVL